MLGTCCIPVNPITLELYIPFAVQPFLSFQLYDLSIHKFFLFSESEAKILFVLLYDFNSDIISEFKDWMIVILYPISSERRDSGRSIIPMTNLAN